MEPNWRAIWGGQTSAIVQVGLDYGASRADALIPAVKKQLGRLATAELRDLLRRRQVGGSLILERAGRQVPHSVAEGYPARFHQPVEVAPENWTGS
jgi:hypothetical protein